MKLPEKRMHCPCDPETGDRLWRFLKANGVPMSVPSYSPRAHGLVYYKPFGPWEVDRDLIGLSIKSPQHNVTPSEFCAAFGLAWPENTNQ